MPYLRYQARQWYHSAPSLESNVQNSSEKPPQTQKSDLNLVEYMRFITPVTKSD